MADIARKMISRATSGDVAAARLVLSYVIGKPAAVPNPDRMDVEELQNVHAERELFMELPKLSMTPQIEMSLEAVRSTRPVATRTYCNRMLQGLKEMDEADKERQRQMAMAEAARSTNGFNGQKDDEPLPDGMPGLMGSPATSPPGQCLDAAHSEPGLPSKNGKPKHSAKHKSR
jgi:hypothetical protein